VTPSAIIARRGPTNSLGQPYVVGQTATCAACGWSGPDRDDRPLPGCPKIGRPGADPHDLVFSPPAHHAAIVARRRPR
jgi:hypothetical protein